MHHDESRQQTTTLGKVTHAVPYHQRTHGTSHAEETHGRMHDPRRFVQRVLQDKKQKQLYARAVKHFNRDPKIALRLLAAEDGTPENEAHKVAIFLKIATGMDISKDQLGEFLGEKNPLAEAVLTEFALLFSFQNDGLVPALRAFLGSFKLPGESQKIDRITGAFAQSYFSQQTSHIYHSWDAVHILTFSVIMLNTDLHSRQVKNHMTLHEFVRNNRGTNIDKSRNLVEDFPREVLEDIFASIAVSQIRLDSGGVGESAAGGGKGGGGELEE